VRNTNNGWTKGAKSVPNPDALFPFWAPKEYFNSRAAGPWGQAYFTPPGDWELPYSAAHPSSPRKLDEYIGPAQNPLKVDSRVAEAGRMGEGGRIRIYKRPTNSHPCAAYRRVMVLGILACSLHDVRFVGAATRIFHFSTDTKDNVPVTVYPVVHRGRTRTSPWTRQSLVDRK